MDNFWTANLPRREHGQRLRQSLRRGPIGHRRKFAGAYSLLARMRSRFSSRRIAAMVSCARRRQPSCPRRRPSGPRRAPSAGRAATRGNATSPIPRASGMRIAAPSVRRNCTRRQRPRCTPNPFQHTPRAEIDAAPVFRRPRDRCGRVGSLLRGLRVGGKGRLRIDVIAQTRSRVRRAGLGEERVASASVSACRREVTREIAHHAGRAAPCPGKR